MKKIVSILIVTALFVSCNKPMGELVGAGNKGNLKDATPYGMAFIPAGSFTMGPNDESLFGGVRDQPKKVALSAFWMDETEITNDEYMQFVNYVKDSIALRMLVLAGRDEYRKPIRDEMFELSPEDALLNWRMRVPWNSRDEEIQDILGTLYFEEEMTLDGTREFDPSKLRYQYRWYDYEQEALPGNLYNIRTGRYPENATVRIDSSYVDDNGDVQHITLTRPLTSKADFLQTRIINIYPDTTAWVSDFQFSFNDPKMKMYFSHGAFAQYPVVGVSWEQAVAFCDWRTQLYYGTNKVRGKEFRLPTEAEWEYAARGGKELGLYPWGGNYVRDSRGCYLANFKPSRAGYSEDTGVTTMQVGSFAPNNYGLYDMAGNVAEWTSSSYSSASSVARDLNPNNQYNAKNDDPRLLKRKVVKGGSWKDVAHFLQCGAKTYQYQDESRPYIGFRCVRFYTGD